MLVRDETLGISLSERPDGTFERVPQEEPRPSITPPVHTVDTSLPDWFEETRLEADNVRRQPKGSPTFAERLTRDAWHSHIAERRQVILAKLAACEVPPGHELQLVRSGAPCGGGGKRLLQFMQELMQWLVDTSDPILHEGMAAFDKRANEMEDELRVVSGASRLSSPYTLENKAIARTNALRIHLARGEIKATSNAGHHCHTAMLRHTTHADAKARLEAIRAGIPAEGEAMAAETWWNYVVDDCPARPDGNTYQDFIAGRNVARMFRERFEASWSAGPAWDGLWPSKRPNGPVIL